MLYEKVQRYLSIISNKDGTSLEKLIDKWNNNIKPYVMTLKTMPKSIKIDDVLKFQEKPKKSKEIKEKKKCPYTFSKGELKSVICGTKVREGNIYCLKHKKYENVVRKEKKIVPTVDHHIVKWNNTEKVLQSYKSLEKIKKENFIIRMHPTLKKFIHKESGYVFHSFEKREVIGKIEPSSAPFWENKEDIITDLTSQDVENCKKYGFPIFIE
jgi:hypothetical protein